VNYPTPTLLPDLVRELSIQDKELRVHPLEPNWAQLRYLSIAEHQLRTTGRIRIIVLKARQLGMSTITEALLFKLAFLFDGYRGLVVAHEIPASQNLLSMTSRYWDTYPYKKLYTPKNYSKNDIAWVETGSSIKISTAGNKAVGRSATIHGLHASELAFWPDPSTSMLGLRQTIPNTPGTMIVMESTANGMGDYFHSQWVAAEEGETEFAPLFLPWWEHYEYTSSYMNLPNRPLGNLDAEEKLLKTLIPENEFDDRINWRRWAIRNLAEGDRLKFMQEYPATPEEAFIASGTNVFPLDLLKQVYEPVDGTKGLLIRNGNQVEFKKTADGPLTLFKAPTDNRDWGQYFVAGDPTHTTRGDFACAQVINRRTMEQVAVWRGRIDPGTFAEELFKLGLYYNTATVTTEIEGPGYMTIGKLLGMNYPKVWLKARPDKTPGKVSSEQYGWSTTVQSKHLAISWLLKCVADGSIAIHHRKTFEEMKNYVVLDNGGYGNANEELHDDTVMALAIACACHAMESPLQAYGELPDHNAPPKLNLMMGEPYEPEEDTW
jgi:hypothetical protein